MSRRHAAPMAGQMVLNAPGCPECGEQSGTQAGLRYDQPTRTTYERWLCAGDTCGVPYEIPVARPA